MPRKKCYGSEAEKQRAYRLRKAGLVLVEKEAVRDSATVGTRDDISGAKPIYRASEAHAIPEGRTVGSNPATGVSPNNLPVPVLAEPQSLTGYDDHQESGEVRESTTSKIPAVMDGDSRGGQTLSCTDQKFEEDRLSWYIFGRLEKEKNCWKCGKKYSTRLEMGRFCSPKCKTAYLDSASHLRQSQ